MSKFANEIVRSIYKTPEIFLPVQSIYNRISGITDGVNKLTGHGNSCMLSMVKVFVNDVEVVDTSYADRWALEKAIKWWFKTCPVDSFKLVHKEEHTRGYV